MTDKKNKYALLFAGQGAQTVGMGADLAAADPDIAALYKKADEILGYSLSSISFEGPAEELTKTSVCQPALYVHGVACLQYLQKRLPDFEFHAAAGLSLGEFTAHHAAGTFTFEDGLRLVAARASYMQDACEKSEGAMAAVIGASENAVRDLASETDVDVANINSPGQIVISGTSSNISLAVSLAKEHGARKAVELSVAGAFHSRLMEPAYEELKDTLAKTDMTPPRVPVVCNVDAQAVGDLDNIRSTLAEQVTGSVRWVESIEYLLDHLHMGTLIELGPGGVLTGLVSRIRKGTPTLSASDAETLDTLITQLKA